MMKKLIFSTFLVFTLGFQSPLFGQDNMILLSPADKDTIHTFNPLLSWSILGGVMEQNGRNFYRLILVEMKEGQSSSAAIIINQPILKRDQLMMMQLFYPYDAPELKEGTHYAWQLQKIVNNVVTEKSEAYSFYIPKPEKPSVSYYKMKTKLDGSVYAGENGKLHFMFNENYTNEQLNFHIYNDKNELVNGKLQIETEKESIDATHIKRSGSNFYTLVYGNTLTNGIYKFVAYNAKKQKFQLLFEVK